MKMCPMVEVMFQTIIFSYNPSQISLNLSIYSFLSLIDLFTPYEIYPFKYSYKIPVDYVRT